jgi:hypothetical protein
MKRGDFSQLVRLRRQREEKALSLLLERQRVLAEAEREAAAANEAVSRHAKESRDHERQRLAGLVGQSLRPGQLVSLQSSLNATADHHQELIAAERQAMGRRESREAELATARGDYRKRHGEAEKLSALMAQEAERAGRKAAAIAETAAEELYVGQHPNNQTPPRTSENGDAR